MVDEKSACNKIKGNGTVSLKEHFLTRLAALEKTFEFQQKVQDQKNEASNEWRQQFKDQTEHFVNKEVQEIRDVRIEDDIKELQLSRARMEGKASQAYVHGVLILAGLSLIMALIDLLVHWK